MQKLASQIRLLAAIRESRVKHEKRAYIRPEDAEVLEYIRTSYPSVFTKHFPDGKLPADDYQAINSLRGMRRDVDAFIEGGGKPVVAKPIAKQPVKTLEKQPEKTTAGRTEQPDNGLLDKELGKLDPKPTFETHRNMMLGGAAAGAGFGGYLGHAAGGVNQTRNTILGTISGGIAGGVGTHFLNNYLNSKQPFGADRQIGLTDALGFGKDEFLPKTTSLKKVSYDLQRSLWSNITDPSGIKSRPKEETIIRVRTPEEEAKKFEADRLAYHSLADAKKKYDASTPDELNQMQNNFSRTNSEMLGSIKPIAQNPLKPKDSLSPIKIDASGPAKLPDLATINKFKTESMINKNSPSTTTPKGSQIDIGTAKPIAAKIK